MGFITKTDISETCDFGSQMSQYASLTAIGKKTGHDVVFIKELTNKRWGLPIIEPFLHKPKVMDVNNFIGQEIGVIKDRILENINLLNSEKNYDLLVDLGLFSYFHEYEKDIIKMYNFNEDIETKSKSFIESCKKENEILVSIHFRRGDYLQFSSLNLSMDYYIAAINSIHEKYENVKFLVFSNDLTWCKQNIDGDCVFVENMSRYEDMCIMSMCNHNIIANSSFSWWGAYLNKSIEKTVICPFNYLNVPEINKHVNGKYYPKEWSAININ